MHSSQRFRSLCGASQLEHQQHPSKGHLSLATQCSVLWCVFGLSIMGSTGEAKLRLCPVPLHKDSYHSPRLPYFCCINISTVPSIKLSTHCHWTQTWETSAECSWSANTQTPNSDSFSASLPHFTALSSPASVSLHPLEHFVWWKVDHSQTAGSTPPH